VIQYGKSGIRGINITKEVFIMHKSVIIPLIIAIIIGVCNFVVVSAHTSHNVISPASSPQKSSPNNDMEEFYRKIGDFGIEIKTTDEIPKLTEEEAIEIAKKSVGEKVSKEAESITAMYVKFTNRPEGMDGPALVLPGTNIVLKDIPVWIVTFHRVNVPRNGPGPMFDSNGKCIPSNVNPYVLGDINIVIDGNNGTELEGFAYNIPVKN
jgi:hypothetical protein